MGIQGYSLPYSDIMIPIEDIYGFDIDEPKYFKPSVKYKDLWELTLSSGDKEILKIVPPTHFTVINIIYVKEDSRYYVIGVADQYPYFFDITKLFSRIRPLCFSQD